MSLFKSREFWSADCEESEEFDSCSLKVCTLNDGHDFLLSGSHMGTLRVFRPNVENDKGHLLGYKPTDLLVEKSLNVPILQIEVGKLVSGSLLRQIAVLHPRSFAVYAFITKKGQTEQGHQSMLNLLYDHKLKRSAANFTVGPFGGTINRDFIAVQSLDGMLSFYEQETFVFCCFLPDFLLPGSFLYIKRTDSFVISGSNLSIESYSYKCLSSAGQNSDENDSGGVKCTPDWTLNVSENIIDINYMYDGFSRESHLVALGEKNLFCFNDNGKLKFMKRFDFVPICFTCYLIGDNVMCLVVSETSTLLIFENTTLKWSAQLPNLPVAIQRGFFDTLKGVLVTLTEDGNLKCSYLGTQPNLFSAPPMKSQELDYEKSNEELSNLNQLIKSAQNELKLSQTANIETELKINIKIAEIQIQAAEGPKEAILEITLTPQSTFEEVNVSINPTRPLEANPKCRFFENCSESTSFASNISLKENSGEIVSLEVQILASCVSTLGVPKVFGKVLLLPSQMCLKTAPPTRDNDIKVILNINNQLEDHYANLAELFPEFMDENGTQNTISLRNFFSGNVNNNVTILIAKSSQRYRLQADSLSAMNLCVAEMMRRLKERNLHNKNFSIAFNGSQLPLRQFLLCLRQHFDCRFVVKELENQLIELGAQFRMVQKRLIAKFKDRNPTPLNNLNMLLEDTYKEILEVCNRLEESVLDLRKCQTELCCTLNLMTNLIIMSNDNIDASILTNILNPFVQDFDLGQTWEDSLDASLEYILRTLLAKSEKDKLRKANLVSYEEVTDIAKLEKHVGIVIERLLKKGLKEDDNSVIVSEAEAKMEKKALLGSSFGESSSRVLSARQRNQSLPSITEKTVEDDVEEAIYN